MSLSIRQATPAEGVQWVRAAFVLFARRALPFTGLFVSFLVAALLVTVVPLLGGVLMLMSLPLLTLGFMLASRTARQDGAVHPGLFIEPLRSERGRRNALLTLCAAYALATVLIMSFSDWVDAGAFEQLQRLLAEGDEALDSEARSRRVVEVEPGEAGRIGRAAVGDEREFRFAQVTDARVVEVRARDDQPIDAVRADQPLVGRQFVVAPGRGDEHVEVFFVQARGQSFEHLDEARVAEVGRVERVDQSDRVGPPHRQPARHRVRPVAAGLGHFGDALACRFAHVRVAVECAADRCLRESELFR